MEEERLCTYTGGDTGVIGRMGGGSGLAELQAGPHQEGHSLAVLKRRELHLSLEGRDKPGG